MNQAPKEIYPMFVVVEVGELPVVIRGRIRIDPPDALHGNFLADPIDPQIPGASQTSIAVTIIGQQSIPIGRVGKSPAQALAAHAVWMTSEYNRRIQLVVEEMSRLAAQVPGPGN